MTKLLTGSFAGVLLALITAYLLITAVLYLLQDRLLYQPDPVLRHTPAAVGLPFDEVVLTTEDGLQLHGWYLPVPLPRGALLFCHGNAGNISDRLESLRQLHSLGLAVLIMDYRGFGMSEGAPDEVGTYRDAMAAWRYLREEQGFAASEIVIFGRSLGGAVAAQLASRVTPAALVLESTFTSVPDLAATLYPWLPVRWLVRHRYPTDEVITRVKAPTLVMHSPDDQIIPYAMGEQLYEAAAATAKQFFSLQGGHNDAFLVTGPGYLSTWAGFLDRHLVALPATH